MKHSIWFFSLIFAVTIPAFATQPAGPGLHTTPMLYDQSVVMGQMDMYNNNQSLIVNVQTTGDWLIHELQLFVHHDSSLIPLKKDRTIFKKTSFNGMATLTNYPYKKRGVALNNFPFKYEYKEPLATISVTLDLQNDLEFNWGMPWEDERVKYVALHANLVRLDAEGAVIEFGEVWADGDLSISSSKWGTMFQYKLTHPQIGHFRDSPVEGTVINSPTFKGKTGESGDFTFFPGESAVFSIGEVVLGTAALDNRVTPLDFFGGSDTTDPRVVNMARLLQSLDADADPKAGITITPEVEACLSAAMLSSGSAKLDFADTVLMDNIITTAVNNCSSLELVEVSAEVAVANLEDDINSYMFRKNVSKTPELASTKAKLNAMPVWFPAFSANGELTEIEYLDNEGMLLRTADEAKPLVVTFTDADPATGAHDTHVAVSRDDGNTWKRANLSRAGDRTSFTLANGEDAYGDVKKPVFQVKGNKILVAWSSKFCKGGKPGYAIELGDDYLYDDPYYVEDIWGVGGPQRSHDYTEDGFPEVGELPYSCVWVARGLVAGAADVSNGVGAYIGDVVWFKPERLTSARRDALQLFMGGAGGAGFALAWQEDPAGLRPGKEAGPGHGWSGATTNHKTDIWYSYITWENFAKVDTNFEVGGDPEHDDPDFIGRPKALVPMSLPIRLSDNDVVNDKNLMNDIVEEDVDVGDGTHAYGNIIPGLCEGFYEFTNNNDELMNVCIADDNLLTEDSNDLRLLDGDTGSSRVNLFLQPYTKPDGTKSAWAIINYEETKGAGAGPPDETGIGESHSEDYIAEEGKNVIYHSFDFQNPDLVSAGLILNFPERDADGNLIYLTDEVGTLIPDWQGNDQLAYENARRARFILQGKSAVGESKTVMLIVYKEGQEGMGRPSDIMLRRVVSKVPGNPYAYSNIICDSYEIAANGKEVCVLGAQNMSTVTPTEVTEKADGDLEAYGYIKVVEWEQTLLNLEDSSSINSYEDARAHRGQIRGDLVTMGYSYTPNWAAARNGNDNYDFVVRRSFDGGQTWTTDPDGSGVTHCQVFTTPAENDGEEATKEEVCTTYAAGEFEQARNLSQLPNAKSSVIEPRIVCPPGTIKKPDGTLTGYPEDIQDKAVCYVAYGTSTNPKKDPVTGEQESAVPEDLFYSFTQDKGESYVEVAWDVNPDSDGNFPGETVYRWDYLAKGEPEQGEVQLRMTPDGSRFYSSWLEEGDDGSDIIFRRIMPPAFPANTSTP